MQWMILSLCFTQYGTSKVNDETTIRKTISLKNFNFLGVITDIPFGLVFSEQTAEENVSLASVNLECVKCVTFVVISYLSRNNVNISKIIHPLRMHAIIFATKKYYQVKRCPIMN